MIRTKLEVWTTRLHTHLDDPDVLDITRRAADAHEKKIPGWHSMPASIRAGVSRRGIERARAHSVRGLTLIQAQRLALDDGLPSLGAPFAPTWDLLKPVKAALELADHHGRSALRLPPEHRAGPLAEAMRLEDEAWQSYLDGWTRNDVEALGFPAQMRVSWKAFLPSWNWALGRHRVALGCLCVKPLWWPAGATWTHCHRFLVAQLLVACGATYAGELPDVEVPPGPQLGLSLG